MIEVCNHDKCTILKELEEEAHALWYNRNALEIAIKIVENTTDEDIEKAKRLVELDRQSKIKK